MGLDLGRFVGVRPRLYHLTAASNVGRILRLGRLDPAAEIFAACEGVVGEGESAAPMTGWDAGPTLGMARVRRGESVVVRVDGDAVHVRDQAPLFAGNVALGDGWAFEDLVEHLNRHVFFWPGGREGPISYGVRHFRRYADDDVVVLVLDTAEVFAANRALNGGPRFCRFNSGSPRCSGGRKSPRGVDTFVGAERFAGTPGSVVEVVFGGVVDLRGCAVEERGVGEFLD